MMPPVARSMPLPVRPADGVIKMNGSTIARYWAHDPLPAKEVYSCFYYSSSR